MVNSRQLMVNTQELMGTVGPFIDGQYTGTGGKYAGNDVN